ncbi:acetate--CoA ligase [Streptomyces sp. NPDC046759]|uniref:acetate--CoA ligase n=1 Tax=Streptomyces sp. NPDC046759 TaxID=3155019 RepID=UPI0033C5B14C
MTDRTPHPKHPKSDAKTTTTDLFPAPGATGRRPQADTEALYARAAADRLGFWAEQARRLSWDQPFTTVLDDTEAPFHRWFTDGTLNASANCLDRHVAAGLGDRVAYHWHGEEGETRTITYSGLLDEVQRFANALEGLGVTAGDVVGIHLPMIPEAVVAMLACARIGAVHNVVFGGFAPQAVGERMAACDARVLVTVDGARRKGRVTAVKQTLEDTLEALPDLEHVVVVGATGAPCPMRPGRDSWYADLCAAADPVCPAVPLPAEHPLFILYSSGSTAAPKGIVHSTGGYLTGVSYTHRIVFDLDPARDVWFCTADIGWITGHSYLVYGPLANGVTSVLFEGAPDHPHKGIWWELVERYGVTQLYTAPTAIRAAMSWGEELPGHYDLSSLRLLGSVGEPINPTAWRWYHRVIGGGRCPIVDTWWQTETGSIMIAPLPGSAGAKPGSATRPLPGVSAALVDADGAPVTTGTGLLTLTEPWPSMLRTLYGDDERYLKTYFSHFGKDTYVVGDAARLDEDGDFWILGRTDDVINVSGHRLSTAEMESAVATHPAVADVAVVAVPDELTGQAVVAFVTPAGDRPGDPALDAELREHIAVRIGKLARPKKIVWAAGLPKTRSGKIMRRLLRDLLTGEGTGDVTTLGEPDVMAALTTAVTPTH